jgi:predicted nucleic acid-binding protein
MRQPVCTIDTSCIIALDHLNLLPQLTYLFSRVLVPKAVRNELFKRRETKDRIQRMLDNFAFIERCDSYDKANVDILLIERAAQGTEDRGEAEAVVQAAAVGAVVIVDDPWGRTLAEKFGRDRHGTFWILTRFFELRLASSADTRGYLEELRRQDVRLPWPLVDQFLVEIGERPLSDSSSI